MEVSIKERKLSSGNTSLYLEFYQQGFRHRESLKGLMLYPDNVVGASKHNKEVMKKAQKIKSESILNPPAHVKEMLHAWQRKQNNDSEEEFENADLSNVDTEFDIETLTWLQWAKAYVEFGIEEDNVKKQIAHKKTMVKKLRAYLRKIKAVGILLKDVKADHISGFYQYLRDYRNRKQIKKNDGHMSPFTLVLCGQTTNAWFNRAIRMQLISYNPVSGLDNMEKFHAPDPHREFLTPEEVERFLSVKTESEQESVVQHAFVFSCMTGLRLSDMHKLRWCHIKPMGEGKCVTLIQQKTKEWVSVPLNDMALSVLPPRPKGNTTSIIYPLNKKADNIAMYCRRIAEKAGIEKDITYHCSRHTVATLAITAGAELSTVGKILGHKSIVSTQVYAKVNLQKKIDVVNLTNGVFE